jgi:hypothetical protein
MESGRWSWEQELAAAEPLDNDLRRGMKAVGEREGRREGAVVE